LSKLLEKIAQVEADVKKLANAPPRCTTETLKRLNDHNTQLFHINHRLKPYKKELPLVF